MTGEGLLDAAVLASYLETHIAGFHSLGAITKFVTLQKRYECIYCVVDMHAITVPQDPVELRATIREVAAAFIAAAGAGAAAFMAAPDAGAAAAAYQV